MLIHSNVAVLLVVLTSCGTVYPGRIIGGHEAVPHSRPYMVLVEKHMSNGEKKYCGGFLLSEDFVMTAAHCQAKNYMVYLGLHNMHYMTDEVQRITVEQAFPHISYDNKTFMNDVMLLKLSSKAKFNGNVKAINLATRSDKALPKSCFVSGWGQVEASSGNLSPKLMEINITLIENEKCRMQNSYCSKGMTGPSHGDSGGPLVCEFGTAYGVVASMFLPHSNEPPLYSSVAQLGCEHIMFFHSKLLVLMTLLTLHGQGQTGKIIGGHVAVPHSRPYMAFIEKHLGNNKKKYCDGFLLNEDFVMTSAHCQSINYTVFLGVDNTNFLHNNDKVQERAVEKAIPHENYNNSVKSNDLMLLKLSSKVVLNNNVKPIALASHDDGTLPKTCIVSGWGQTEPYGAISPKLMEMNVTLTDNEQCAKYNLYCSKGTSRPGQGDSGGPLVCGCCTAYGVVSFMIQHPNDLPVVAYTKIPDYIDWITSTMKKTLSKN
ncbi:hypothetical protein CHARACLAT_008724 [Characodon lateralis]|uniref:Peptidase S1 domain-containing protein n=1 Tax=Characodon lateralis TaxID=208331 RepID=A0ABU7E107_9TELE|nr:hypothetical protein [Characodon lateralis]